jgi:hypothetical protein
MQRVGEVEPVSCDGNRILPPGDCFGSEDPKGRPWRDPAVLLISQLKEIYIASELDVVDTTQWYPRVMRKDFAGDQGRRRRSRPGVL